MDLLLAATGLPLADTEDAKLDNRSVVKEEEPEEVLPTLPAAVFTQPFLPYKEIAVLAVLNTDDKCLSEEDIGMFVEHHFPFYKYDSELMPAKLRPPTFQKFYSTEKQQWMYRLDDKQLARVMKIFHKFYRAYPDPSGKPYSMRYPELWEMMLNGEYRENLKTSADEPSTSTPTKPIVYLRPEVNERYLLALALFNAEGGHMQAEEIFAFIEYHFPYYEKNNANWVYTGFRHLNAVNGNFGLNKEGNTERYYLYEDKIGALGEALAKFMEEYPDPKHYGMRHPELWDSMLRGDMKSSIDHCHLIPKIRFELDERRKNKKTALKEDPEVVAQFKASQPELKLIRARKGQKFNGPLKTLPSGMESPSKPYNTRKRTAPAEFSAHGTQFVLKTLRDTLDEAEAAETLMSVQSSLEAFIKQEVPLVHEELSSDGQTVRSMDALVKQEEPSET